MRLSPKQIAAQWDPPMSGRCNFRLNSVSDSGKKGRCKKYPLTGDRHCKKHRRPHGETHHAWKGGRSQWTKKHLPKRLLASFDAIVNDPEITSVRDLLAVAGGRLTELYQKLDTAEARASWDRLREEILPELLVFETRLRDPKERAQYGHLLKALKRCVKRAHTEHLIWDEVTDLWEQVRKLSDTERKRDEMLAGNLTSAQTIALFNQLFAMLSEEVTDADARRRIGNRLHTLLEGQQNAGLLKRR